jgi:hypothetical protein
VIKSVIALHFARGKAARVIHAGMGLRPSSGPEAVADREPSATGVLVLPAEGFCPAGDEDWGSFADELMELSRSLADSGALWDERIESLYLQASLLTDAVSLEILTPQGSGSS